MTSTEDQTGWTYLMDMDGVLVHEEHLIPGADTFLAELASNDIPYMVLTNNSIRTPRDLRARLLNSGLDIPEKSIWTSALATATFLANQRPGGSAYVVGESGLTTALHDIGYVLTDQRPRLRRPRRDANVLLRGNHHRHSPGRAWIAVHRHQPGRHRAVA